MWTAYSRRASRVIAFEIGDRGIGSCLNIYKKAKAECKNVEQFYSDGNSCYRLTFERHMPEERLTITKAQTHLIESSNSSIRDNLARFNRRTKRYSKSWEMLRITLTLFFNRGLLEEMTGVAMTPYH
ncbi:MAG: hypothetical protein LBL61_01645 [Elusimicrobiota bacterium]|nr:hypothetical protein [Elusimicrobiota bacterium]